MVPVLQQHVNILIFPQEQVIITTVLVCCKLHVSLPQNKPLLPPVVCFHTNCGPTLFDFFLCSLLPALVAAAAAACQAGISNTVCSVPVCSPLNCSNGSGEKTSFSNMSWSISAPTLNVFGDQAIICYVVSATHW